MEIILLAGRAGVGKTTAAQAIATEAFDNGFIPILESFAKPIKDEANEKGWTKDEHPEKYRDFCQKMGAEGRVNHKDYWVDLMEDRLSKLLIKEREDLNSGKKYWERVVVIDDCRYLNEINLGYKLEATLIFLSYGKRSINNDEWRLHESEQLANALEDGDIGLQDRFPWIISNDLTQEAFIRAIKRWTPLWCGLTVEEEFDPEVHDPDEWKLYSKNPQDKSISDLLDLLEFRFDGKEILFPKEEKDDEENEETD